jgi:hypothetical protein
MPLRGYAMRKILLVAITVLACLSQASANPYRLNPKQQQEVVEVDVLPQSMQGNWCPSIVVGKFRALLRKKCASDRQITIGSLRYEGVRYEGEEVGCDIMRIQEIVKGRVYRIGMNCADWKAEKILNISKDRSILYLTNEWDNKKRIDDFLEKLPP